MNIGIRVGIIGSDPKFWFGLNDPNSIFFFKLHTSWFVKSLEATKNLLFFLDRWHWIRSNLFFFLTSPHIGEREMTSWHQGINLFWNPEKKKERSFVAFKLLTDLRCMVSKKKRWTRPLIPILLPILYCDHSFYFPLFYFINFNE